jgi:hypothetical protein
MLALQTLEPRGGLLGQSDDHTIGRRVAQVRRHRSGGRLPRPLGAIVAEMARKEGLEIARVSKAFANGSGALGPMAEMEPGQSSTRKWASPRTRPL